jgi:hypothetical protein
MAFEKVKAFDHLFPSREHVVKRYGYDPKQLHHIIRLYDLLLYDVPIYKYEGEDKTKMISIKRGLYECAEANKLKEEYMKKIVELAVERKLVYEIQPIDYEKLNKIVIEENLGRKISTEKGKVIYTTISSIRTFNSDIPKFIRSNISEEVLKEIEHKDLNINIQIEIEEL